MKPISLLAAFFATASLVAAPGARAEVVRPAPNFTWGAGKTLAHWKGQPVILLIAPSPRSAEFRKQAKRIEADYQELAARNALFAAAFTDPAAAGETIRCNVPFVVLPEGGRVAAAYGFDGRFGLYVIGRDGNLDLTASKVAPASRIMDMIINNAEQQAAERKRSVPVPR